MSFTRDPYKLQLSEYKHPFLQTIFTQRHCEPIDAAWLTHNFLILNPYKPQYKLFDIGTQLECKSIKEQIEVTNKPLSKAVRAIMKASDLENCSVNGIITYASFMIRYAEYRLPVAPYQFITVTCNDITFWNTKNPNQLTITKRIDTPLPKEEKDLPAEHAGKLGMHRKYFKIALFPDKYHMAIMVNRNHFYFIHLASKESFDFYTENRYENIKIINNKQVLLFRQYGDFEQIFLMTIDLKKRRAKVNEEKPFIPYEKNILLPLATGLVLKISDKNEFNCFSVSEDGNQFNAISSLSGNASLYTQLNTGEVVFWDKHTQLLNLLNPYKKQIIPLGSIENVVQILSCDREVLILTPETWHHCFIPNDYKKNVNHLLLEDFNKASQSILNIIHDYADTDRADNPSLLTQFSFLCVKKSESMVESDKKDYSPTKLTRSKSAP